MMDSLVRIENRGQLIYMLSEAAELEHGIMCCYLFCAFSMKRSVEEGVTEEQLNSMQRVAQDNPEHRRRRDAAYVLGLQPSHGGRRRSSSPSA